MQAAARALHPVDATRSHDGARASSEPFASHYVLESSILDQPCDCRVLSGDTAPGGKLRVAEGAAQVQAPLAELELAQASRQDTIRVRAFLRCHPDLEAILNECPYPPDVHHDLHLK